MFVDCAPPRAARSPRRTDADRVRDALLALAGGHGLVLSHSERSWASVTFTGVRHRLTLAFAGMEAVEAGELFISGLPEHEFAIPRQIVGDASVLEVEHTLFPQPRLKVECELLLLDEA